METEIDILDLFSGIGGFSKGLSDAGFKIINHYFSEIDKHAIACYSYNFKNAKYVGSVTNVSGIVGTIGTKRERPLFITFGWPCQDNSIAGKRKGQREGTRSGLLTQAGMLIDKLRPQVFIAENVKGLFSVNAGYDFYEAIRFLTYLNSDSPEYTVEMQLLNTSWVLPQNRERTYFIGHLGKGSIKRIFPIGESDCGANEGAANSATVRTITAGGHSGGHHSGMTLIKTLGGSDTLNTMRNGGRGSLTEKHSWDIVKVLSHYGHKNKEAMVSDISPTLKAESHGHEPMVFAQRGRYNSDGKTEQKTEVRNDGNTNTLTSVEKDNMLSVNNNIRRLTEIECERLQGFPDNYTKYGIYDGTVKEIPKTSRYKLCGNAVTRDIVELIGRKLLK